MTSAGHGSADARAAGPSYPIASVDNALRLILMFSNQRELRLSAAAAQLGIANSTAHRLLAMLRHYDFVRQNPETKTYVAGPALIQVGLGVIGRMDIRGQARPWLEELAKLTGETVHLSVLEGTSIRYLDSIESDWAVRVASRMGQALPAHCSSAGKALLSALSAESLQRLYDGVELLPATRRSITTLPALEREVRKAQRRGYASATEESQDGICAVAVPVHLAGQVAAFSVAAPCTRMRADRLAECAAIARDVAARFEDAMGVTNA